MMYRAPPGCVAVSCGGVDLVVAPDGMIHASEASAPLLLAHGITPCATPPRVTLSSKDIAAMGRAAVIAALLSHGAGPPFPRSLGVLRDLLRTAIARSDKPNHTPRG